MWIKLHKPLIVSFAVLFPAWPIVVLAGGPPEANGWLSSVNLAYAWQGRGNLEDGGDFSVDRGVIEFEAMRRDYYLLRGWDPNTGLPTTGALETLNLSEAAQELQQSGLIG